MNYEDFEGAFYIGGFLLWMFFWGSAWVLFGRFRRIEEPEYYASSIVAGIVIIPMAAICFFFLPVFLFLPKTKEEVKS